MDLSGSHMAMRFDLWLWQNSKNYQMTRIRCCHQIQDHQLKHSVMAQKLRLSEMKPRALYITFQSLLKASESKQNKPNISTQNVQAHCSEIVKSLSSAITLHRKVGRQPSLGHNQFNAKYLIFSLIRHSFRMLNHSRRVLP